MDTGGSDSSIMCPNRLDCFRLNRNMRGPINTQPKRSCDLWEMNVRVIIVSFVSISSILIGLLISLHGGYRDQLIQSALI